MLASASVASIKFESLRIVSISDGWGELLVRLKRCAVAHECRNTWSLFGQARKMW
jgi:hypothetical protein